MTRKSSKRGSSKQVGDGRSRRAKDKKEEEANRKGRTRGLGRERKTKGSEAI